MVSVGPDRPGALEWGWGDGQGVQYRKSVRVCARAHMYEAEFRAAGSVCVHAHARAWCVWWEPK